MKKFIILDQYVKTIKHPTTNKHITLKRIKALKSFGKIKKGDIGGWIRDESNLSHKNNCWVFEEAEVFDNICLYEDMEISGNFVYYGSSNIEFYKGVATNCLSF